MKQTGWILNGVLAMAVVVLFVLHFVQQGDIGEPGKPVHHAKDTVAASGLKVGYVFVDSLLSHYAMYQELADRLVKRKEGLENELASKGSALEKEISDYQYKVQKHLITSWEAADQEKKLGEKQQVLVNLQNDMQNRLMQEEAQLNQQIHDSVMLAVQKFNETRGYNLILSHTFGGVVLYADDYMNVTQDVLELLNSSYQEGKK